MILSIRTLFSTTLITVFATIFILITAIYFSLDQVNNVAPSEKLNIICTTTILADAVHSIGKEHVNVHSLMGAGVDPHKYRARESDAHKIKSADLILYHGLDLEGKMAHIFEQASAHMNTAAVSTIIKSEDLLESDIPGTYDPHIWHDVTLWARIVEYVSHILVINDPEHAEYYYKNAKQYLKKLEYLDASVRKKIASIPGKKRYLITAHDAFSYFGKQYGMKVVGLQGINTQAEVSIADVSSVTKTIVRLQIPTIFVETSTPKRNIWAVQNAVAAHNWQVKVGPELFSDALDVSGSPAESYIGMINYNVNAIINSLQPSPFDR